MRTLAVYLKNYKKESVLAPFFKFLEVVCDLIVPIVIAQIIDIGVAENDRGYIVQRFFILLLLAAAGLTVSIIAQYFAAKASTGFAAELRQDLFDHVQGLSFAELDRLGTDTLITRLTDDINQVQNGLNMGLRLLLRSPFVVFGSMVMAFTINVRCALIFAVAIPVLFIVVFLIMFISIPLFKKVQGKLDMVTRLTRENLTGVRVIRAFCREETSVEEFEMQSQALTRLNEFVGRISALLNPVTYVLINIATVILIDRAGIQVNLGNMQQGEVVALYNYMAQMIVELIKLASLIITLNKAMACAGRVAGVLRVKSGMAFPNENGEKAQEAPERERTTEDAVCFEDVTFTYQGSEVPSLSHISFTAKKGQTIGVIGGTGSGKTTLVNLIPRFYDIDSGNLRIEGKDVKSFTKKTLCDKIGIVPQKAVLFKGSVRENLRWGNETATDEEIWAAIEVAQAREVVESKRGMLDFGLEQNGRNLSGGQRQRLTIARALVGNPEILILDDSASALDFATDAALRQAIRRLSGHVTTFLVSQRAASIRQADLILVLDDGEMAGKGTHEELLHSCKTYQEIYYSQFPEERPDQRKAEEPVQKGSVSGKRDSRENAPASGEEVMA